MSRSPLHCFVICLPHAFHLSDTRLFVSSEPCTCGLQEVEAKRKTLRLRRRYELACMHKQRDGGAGADLGGFIVLQSGIERKGDADELSGKSPLSVMLDEMFPR